VLGGESLEDWGDGFTWSAPCSVEVNYEEGLGLRGVELGERFDFLHLDGYRFVLVE